MAYPAVVRSLPKLPLLLRPETLPPRRGLPVRPEHDRAQSCAIALRSPASERPSDANRYSPDIHRAARARSAALRHRLEGEGARSAASLAQTLQWPRSRRDASANQQVGLLLCARKPTRALFAPTSAGLGFPSRWTKLKPTLTNVTPTNTSLTKPEPRQAAAAGEKRKKTEGAGGAPPAFPRSKASTYNNLSHFPRSLSLFQEN
eukprot:scaffold57397_cov71-Phaeocystis_antarctica.AAC.1